MGQRVSVGSELKPLGVGAAKASVNSACVAWRHATELPAEDPKPSDLAMARLKVG
ncbi:MAG: hypothetical protein NVS1B13_26970 [Flavisolibacter sp.]